MASVASQFANISQGPAVRQAQYLAWWGSQRGTSYCIFLSRITFKLFSHCTDQLERSWLEQGPRSPHHVGGINHLVAELWKGLGALGSGQGNSEGHSGYSEVQLYLTSLLIGTGVQGQAQ